MSWTNMVANYVDAVWSGLRKFAMTTNQDNTVSFEDETQYTQQGSYLGASDCNAIVDNLNYLKGMPVQDLAEITSVADSDVLPIYNGSATKKIRIANLLKQQKLPELSNAQDVTVSVDALGNVARHYFVVLSSYGAQAVCGIPENSSYYCDIYVQSANYKRITMYNMGTSGTVWQKVKSGGTWSSWKLLSGVYSGTVTRGTMMNTSDAIGVNAAGSMGVLNVGARIATAGTYGNTNVLFTSSIKPNGTQNATMALGSELVIVKINSSGQVAFNSSKTVSANTYLIGQIVFPISNLGV